MTGQRNFMPKLSRYSNLTDIFLFTHTAASQSTIDSEPLFLLLPDFIEGRPPSFLLGLSVPCWLLFQQTPCLFHWSLIWGTLYRFQSFLKSCESHPFTLGKPTFSSEFAHLFPTLNANSFFFFFFFLIRKKYILAYQTWSCTPILKFLLCLIIIFMDYQ